MFSYLTNMIIDEARAHVLTKYSKKKSKVVLTESDHNPIICHFNQLWSDHGEEESQRYEIFQFNDAEGALRFNAMTSTSALSNCIQGNNVKRAGKKWIKTLNNCLHRSFKKIRVKHRRIKQDEVHDFMIAKSAIQIKIDDILKQVQDSPSDIAQQTKILVSLNSHIDRLDSKIADLCAEKNVRIIKEHFATITDDSGSFNIPKMWGLKKKLQLGTPNVPTAKKDKSGNLVTTKNGLLALYKQTYMERLSPKDIKPEYDALKNLKENLFQLRYQLARQDKSKPWEVKDIEKICKALKNSKARDECGLVYELFKQPYAGQDIFKSLTKLFNLIKYEVEVPDFFELMSITSLYKNKGLKSDLSNERGIFGISKVRSIFEKLIYSEFYGKVDGNMSFSNVGGRKNRNIRDNLFVVYASINDVINGRGESFDIHGYDVIKCFDEMWYEDTLNDLWDVEIQDDNFCLLSKLDERCKVVVKTPSGTTDRFELYRIVLQGSVFGPLKCAVQMDTLGREALQSGVGIFKYKNSVNIPSLAMIDDVMGMSACGDSSVELNAIINSKIETRKLRLSKDKCFKIHISKTGSSCHQILKVHDDDMKNVSQATYLGDVISEKGSIDETIVQRGQKATGIITQISSILSSISLGSYYFDIALVLREAKFVNAILTNSEVWHDVRRKHLESLEASDIELLRKILNAHSKTSKEAFFLELGIVPLRFHVSMRRFMYLWHLLRRTSNELINKVYVAQKCETTKGDWAKIIEEEKIKYNLTESNEQILKMSKQKFRKKVKQKILSHAVKYLKEIAEPHSKSIGIRHNSFKRQPYFQDRRFSKDDVQLLFALRTKMLECKSNYSELFNKKLHCRLCNAPDVIENEDHLLVCTVLENEATTVQFSDVYGSVNEQYEAIKIFKKVVRKWRVYLDTM